jgi:predicted deacylase
MTTRIIPDLFLQTFIDSKSLAKITNAFEISHNFNKNPKTLIVMCANHGNEPAGVLGALAIKNAYDNKLLDFEGRLIFVLANPKAYNKGLRLIDYNLNRAFSVEARTNHPNAYEVLRSIELEAFLRTIDCDMVVDMHSFPIGDDALSICYSENVKSVEFLQKNKFLPYTVYFPFAVLPGTLLSCTLNKPSCISITFEAGSHNASYIEQRSFSLIKECMYQNGMLKGDYQSTLLDYSKQYKTIDSIKTPKGFVWTDEVLNSFGKQFVTPIKKDVVYAQSEQGFLVSAKDQGILMPGPVAVEGDLDIGFFVEEVL